jgi:uncharacterized lipoprotein YmbA
MLTEPKMIKKYYNKNSAVIGVEKISLPEYMLQGRVAIGLSSTEIRYLDSAKWIEDMESSLTKQLITTIQKSFNNPKVYAYPWDLSKQADIKIKVNINRFIAYGDRVYLDANYEIKRLKSGKLKGGLFSTTVPTNSSSASIVSSMNLAFSKLTKKLIYDLSRE